MMSDLKEILQPWIDFAKREKATWDERIRVLRQIVRMARERGNDVVYLPVEEEAREIIKKYLAESKPSKNLEMQMMGVIVKYLLLNYINLDACTEFEMEKRLGVPRHRLRKLLGFLEWEEIVTAFEVGSTKPYIVIDLSKALREGYLKFSKEEAEDLAKVIIWLSRPSIKGLGMAVEYHNPKNEVFYMLHQSIPNWKVPLKITVFLSKILLNKGGFFMYIYPFKEPLFPDEMKPKASWAVEKAGIAHDWMLLRDTLDSLPIFFRELLFELGIPDDVSDEELNQALKRVVEKYVRAIDALFKPLSNLLKGHPIPELKEKVTKWRMDLKKEDLLMTGGMTAEDVKGVVMGITQDYQFIGDWSSPINKEHVAFVLSILKAAERVGEFAGIRKSIITSIKEQIQIIEDRLSQSQD